MCLVFAAYRYVPGYRLLVVANRDEYHGRATAAAEYWDDAPAILAGRDLEAGGSWLGITRDGRFATLTNYREAVAAYADPPSRGQLVTNFLNGRESTGRFLAALHGDAHRYNGFNLLVDDGESLGYCSNRDAPQVALEPGLYGLSNHLLDTPWPKVESGKRRLGALLANGTVPDHETLFGIMRDRVIPPEDLWPQTGVPRDFERVLTPAFVLTAAYGTRATTLVGLRDDGGGFLLERAFDADGRELSTVEHQF
ncbi:MAG: NRDE family protein [Pseudomonadota bacterium]